MILPAVDQKRTLNLIDAGSNHCVRQDEVAEKFSNHNCHSHLKGPRKTEIGSEFYTGPFSVRTHSVKNNTQVLIKCRNNKKLQGRVKAFDRHCRMVLKNAKEM